MPGAVGASPSPRGGGGVACAAITPQPYLLEETCYAHPFRSSAPASESCIRELASDTMARRKGSR